MQPCEYHAISSFIISAAYQLIQPVQCCSSIEAGIADAKYINIRAMINSIDFIGHVQLLC